MIRALLVTALLAAPLSVLAQTGTGGPSEATANAGTSYEPARATGDSSNGDRSATTGDPNRRICRKTTATGSRIATARVCKTAREWEAQRLAAKDELDRHQRSDGTNF